MRWTPDVIERLRTLAAEGKSTKQIARILGAPIDSTRVYAGKAGISIARAPEYEPELGARWRAIIGPMKRRLRADILRIQA